MKTMFESTVATRKNVFCMNDEIPKECIERSKDSADSKKFVDPQCQPSTNVGLMKIEGPSLLRARPTVNKGKCPLSLKVQETTRAIVNFFAFSS